MTAQGHCTPIFALCVHCSIMRMEVALAGPFSMHYCALVAICVVQTCVVRKWPEHLGLSFSHVLLPCLGMQCSSTVWHLGLHVLGMVHSHVWAILKLRLQSIS
jgi:hypothetical protein